MLVYLESVKPHQSCVLFSVSALFIGIYYGHLITFARIFKGGNWDQSAIQKQNTNNTFAKSPDAKNQLGPIAVVLWGTGYAAIVTINTF